VATVTGLSAFQLRRANAEDLDFLEKLYAECHSREFAPLGLSDSQLEGLMRMQARGQREGYARDFPAAEDHIVVDSAAGSPVGRMLVDTGAERIHLIDIAMLPAWRKRGIGKALLQGLIRQANETGRAIRLHVRPENPAAELYRRLGFSEVSRGLQVGLQVEMEYRPDAPERPAAREAQPQKPHPVAEKWNARVGRNFVVGNVQWEEGPLALGLVSVDTARGFGAGCFALMFHGPLSAILPQSTYLLLADSSSAAAEPPSVEEEIVFLVPVGPEGEAMRYEAVFNL